MVSLKPIQQLVSIHLFENESHNNLFPKLSYPSISHTLRTYIEKHLNEEYFDNNSEVIRFGYHHIEDVWIYIYSNDSLAPNLVIGPEVKQFSIVVISKDFNPEKYEIMTKIFSKVYAKTGQTNRLLSYYLSILISGSFSVSEEHNNSLKFNFDDYDQLEVIHSKSAIKSVIKLFGLDVILIYTALILKKRIAVYHHKLETLVQFIRVLPAFVWHRTDCFQSLYPCVELGSQLEIQQLQSRSHYIAGFLDSDVENRIDLYDIYVNLAAVEITVSHTAKDVFSMTKTHKEIAVFMSRQADNPSNTDFDVIRDICDKNRELIRTLKMMGNIDVDCTDGSESSGNKVITIEAIKEKKLNQNLENFLWNLAVAEDLV